MDRQHDSSRYPPQPFCSAAVTACHGMPICGGPPSSSAAAKPECCEFSASTLKKTGRYRLSNKSSGKEGAKEVGESMFPIYPLFNGEPFRAMNRVSQPSNRRSMVCIAIEFSGEND